MKFSDYVSRLKGDKILWVVIFLMSCISILVVYSATGALAFRQAHGNTTFYIFRQVIVQLMGFMVILLMIKNLKINFYQKVGSTLLLAAMGCILLGILIGRGSGRTIPLGFFSFQPAELAKVAIIIWVARILTKSAGMENAGYDAFFRIMTGLGALAFLLLMVNFSSAVLVVAASFIMMYVARVPMKLLLGSVVIVLAILIGLFLVRDHLPKAMLEKTRLETVFGRVDRFISGKDPKQDEGITQDEFAKIAIYNGGILGVGAGKGDISNRMSAAYNDFIFSIIVEEYGLVGASVVIFLYLVLLTRGWLIIRASKNTYAKFLAMGAVTMIMLQALVNMGVSSGAIPVTGQPLPWISWGGTSQLFTAIIFGLILSVSAESQAGIAQIDKEEDPGEDDSWEDDILLNFEK